MGLFIFLIIMLAAAWGMVWELNQPPPPPAPVPSVQHSAPAAKVSEAAAAPPEAVTTQEIELGPPADTQSPDNAPAATESPTPGKE